MNYYEIISAIPTVKEQLVWIAKHIEKIVPELERESNIKCPISDIADKPCSEDLFPDMCEDTYINRKIIIPCLIEDLDFAQKLDDSDEKFYATILVYYIIATFFTHEGVEGDDKDKDEGEQFSNPFANIIENKTDLRNFISLAEITLSAHCGYECETLYSMDYVVSDDNISEAIKFIEAFGLSSTYEGEVCDIESLATFLCKTNPKSAFIIQNSQSEYLKQYNELFDEVAILTQNSLEFSNVELDEKELIVTFEIKTGDTMNKYHVSCQPHYDPMVLRHINQSLDEIGKHQICAFFLNKTQCCFAYLPYELILKIEDLGILERGESGLDC